jgi:hypothetical protein
MHEAHDERARAGFASRRRKRGYRHRFNWRSGKKQHYDQNIPIDQLELHRPLVLAA